MCRMFLRSCNFVFREGRSDQCRYFDLLKTSFELLNQKIHVFEDFVLISQNFRKFQFFEKRNNFWELFLQKKTLFSTDLNS